VDNINLARLEKLKNSYGVLKRVSLDEYKLVIEKVRDEIAVETEQVRPVKPFKSDFQTFRETMFGPFPAYELPDPNQKFGWGISELYNDPFGWGVNDDDWDL